VKTQQIIKSALNGQSQIFVLMFLMWIYIHFSSTINLNAPNKFSVLKYSSTNCAPNKFSW